MSYRHLKTSLLLVLTVGLVLASGPVRASLVTDIRLGLHPQRTRLVIDLNGRFKYRLDRPRPDRAVIILPRAGSGSKGLNRRGIGLISSVRAQRQAQGLRINVSLKGPASAKATAWRQANRLIVDFRPQTAPPKPAVKPQPAAKVKPQPAAPVAKKEATESKPKPNPIGFLVGATETPPQQVKTVAAGLIGPPPQAEKPAQPAAGVVVESQPSKQAEGKITRTLTQAKSLAQQSMEGGRRDAELAREALEQADLYGKQGFWDQARPLYERAEKLSRDDDIIRRAIWGQAEADYQLNLKTGQPHFMDVDRAYQKFLGAFPKAPQVPEALLKLGLVNARNLSLAPAKGYFNLILRDYPKSPQSVEAMIQLATILVADGSVNPAIRFLRQVVDHHLDNPRAKQALWDLGKILYDIGRYHEAQDRFAKLMEMDKGFYIKEPMLLYYLGETAFRLGKPTEARRFLFWVLNIYPKIPNQDLIMARIGDTYRAEGNYLKAMAIYADVERRWPETDGALISRIRMAETSGRAAFGKKSPFSKLEKVFGVETTGDALTTYRQIAKQYPKRAVAQLARLKEGAYYFSLGEYDKSFGILQKLLEEHPETEFFRDGVYILRQSFAKQMARMEEQKQPAKMIDFYETNKKWLPQQLRQGYGRMLGRAYFELKLYDQAVSHLEGVVKAGKADAVTLGELAQAYYHLGRHAEAAAAFKRFLAQYPAHGQVGRCNRLMGESLMQAGQFDQAAAAFKRAAEVDPGGPDYWTVSRMRVEALISAKRYKDALTVMAALMKTIPPDKKTRRPFLALMGDAAMGLKKYDKAAQAYAAAVEGVPAKGENLATFYRLGVAYLKAGNRGRAKAAFDLVTASGDPFWSNLAKDRLMVADVKKQIDQRQEVVNQ